MFWASTRHIITCQPTDLPSICWFLLVRAKTVLLWQVAFSTLCDHSLRIGLTSVSFSRWFYFSKMSLHPQFFNGFKKNYNGFSLYICLVLSDFYHVNGGLAHHSVAKLKVELLSVSKELEI